MAPVSVVSEPSVPCVEGMAEIVDLVPATDSAGVPDEGSLDFSYRLGGVSGGHPDSLDDPFADGGEAASVPPEGFVHAGKPGTENGNVAGELAWKVG